MKEGKKLLSLSLAAAMTLGLAAPAMAAEETTAPEQGKIVILHTNDVHCQIDQAKEAAMNADEELKGRILFMEQGPGYMQGEESEDTNR